MADETAVTDAEAMAEEMADETAVTDAEAMAEEMAATLYDLTFAESRAERDRRAQARNLIGREDCEPEFNRMGTMRWYLHPHLETPSTRALYFHELEIPQHSNSGKLYCQGGMIHFVLVGSGHTVLDGRAHEWEEGDVIAIPIRESGVTYQHFNTGVGPTRMLVCWANLDSAISPEGGVAMEVLEPCPEWQARHG